MNIQRIIDNHPVAFLWSACIVCYALTALSPSTLGIIDYVCLVLCTAGLYWAADRVYYLKAAKGVFFIQPLVVFILLMAMIDGFAPSPIGFWFDNQRALTTSLCVLELLALLMWTPWEAISEGLHRTFHNLRLNSRYFDILNKRDSISMDKD